MKKLLFIFLLFPLLSTAQDIKGTIVSQLSNLPIDNTNVSALFSKSGTVSNDKGVFSIYILPKFKDDEILEFSHLGYITQKLSISSLKKNAYKVVLEEEIQNLSDVTIAPNQKLKTKLTFSEISTLKNPIYSFGSFFNEGKIYVSGGDGYEDIDKIAKVRAEKAVPTMGDFLDANQTSVKRHYKKYLSIYDIKTNSWQFPELKLQGRAYHNIHFYNNLIYVLGGKKMFVNKISSWEYLQDQIEVLDLDKSSIKIDKTNPHQAADFASFTYNDNIIVLGGSVKMTESGKKDFTNKVHLYNITSGYWYELNSMPTAKETTGILIDNKIYLIGGNNGKAISQIESYDLLTEKWKTEGELFSPFERPAITFHENMIYFFEDRKICTYDLKTKLLTEYEIDLGLKFAAMYYDNDKLYILGGRIDNSYSKIPSAKVLSIEIHEFKSTKPNRTKFLSQDGNLTKVNQ